MAAGFAEMCAYGRSPRGEANGKARRPLLKTPARRRPRERGRASCVVLGARQFVSLRRSRRPRGPLGMLSMQTVLIVIHLLVVIALVAVVLLQRSEGGVLGAGGGGGFMTGRGQANALSRATAILGTLFFVTAILMSIIAELEPRAALDHRQRRPGLFELAPRRRRRRAACSTSSSRCKTSPAAPRRPAPAAPAQEPPK